MREKPRRLTHKTLVETVRKVVGYLRKDERKLYSGEWKDRQGGCLFESVDLLSEWLEYEDTARRTEHWVISLVVCPV